MNSENDRILEQICRSDRDYGRSLEGSGLLTQVEFVSANPTGPLTVEHGRSAALGDALANLMTSVGFQVRREFYVNDADLQLERLGRSVEACYLQLQRIDAPFPEDGYQPEYALHLARSVLETDGPRFTPLPDPERARVLTSVARDRVLSEQRATLDRLGVRFDRWFSENELHDSGKIRKVVERLRAAGYVYDEEGAAWLRSTAFGDSEDRTLVRSSGLPTYIAADIAYHLDKFERGFDRVIDVWGWDHTGYVARTRAALLALGIDPDRLEVVVFQSVTLKVDGLPVEGAGRKRLQEVMDEVGAETVRFFYLSREARLPLELDLDLAARRDDGNPLYAVRQAHTRATALASAEAPGRTGEPAAVDPLFRLLESYPAVVRQAADARDPQQVAAFAIETAARFNAYERALQTNPGNGAATRSTTQLANASRIVLRNALAILGVSAPEGT